MFVEKLYPYRFIIALVILCLVIAFGWFNDIAELQSDVAHTKQTIIRLQQQKLSMKNVIAQPFLAKSKHKNSIPENKTKVVLQSLLQLIKQQHLRLQSIMIGNETAQQPLSIKLIVIGNSSEVLAFVETIYAQPLGLVIADFDYQLTTQHAVQLTALLKSGHLLNQKINLIPTSSPQIVHQPFCDDASLQLLES